MSKNQQILEELEAHAASILPDYKPTAHNHLRKGTIERMKAYLTEFPKKMEEYSVAVTDKANALLNGNREEIEDMDTFKQEMTAKCKEAISKFIREYKPK